MQNEKLTKELINELESRVDLEITFSKLAKNIFNIETVYYTDIVSIVSIYNDFENARKRFLIYESEAIEIYEFFKEKRIEIANKIIEEQKMIYEENLKSIKRKLEKIPLLISNGKNSHAIKYFNELFLDFHSKYYQEYLRLISKEFDPRESNYFTYSQNKAWYLLKLKDKILFEKQLIHQDFLVQKIYSNKNFKYVIELLNKGEIFESLRFLENISIQNFYIFKKKYSKSDDYTAKGRLDRVFREPSSMLFILSKMERDSILGILNKVDYYLRKFELVSNILSYVEYFVKNNIESFLKDLKDKKDKETTFSIEVKKSVKMLLSKAKIKEAIEVLEDYLGDESAQEIKNELIINEARLSKNEQNRRKGIEHDKDLENKIINSLLDLLEK